MSVLDFVDLDILLHFQLHLGVSHDINIGSVVVPDFLNRGASIYCRRLSPIV